MSRLRKGLLALSLASLVGGCANQSHYTSVADTPSPDKAVRLDVGLDYRSAVNRNITPNPEPQIISLNAWELTREHLHLPVDIQNTRIKRELMWLESNPRHVNQVSQQALPYYHYVLSQVLERGMPAEVSLIPFIESGFNPFAVSPAKAAGAWQFMPSTAKNFGLESNWWYDGRRDIIASTDAALNYLSYLNEMFDGDWLLTFAAYNAGEGNVLRAIKRNSRANQPTDYWSLQLPGETMRYVPKILATAKAIRDADRLGLQLEEIPAEPYFAKVYIGGQLALSQAAELADIDLDELKRLNPGFGRWATAPEGPHRLLIPVANAEQFQTALVQLPVENKVNFQHYTIIRGDTLSTLARRFGTTVAALQQANQMNSTKLRIGQTLLVPADGSEIALQTSPAESG